MESWQFLQCFNGKYPPVKLRSFECAGTQRAVQRGCPRERIWVRCRVWGWDELDELDEHDFLFLLNLRIYFHLFPHLFAAKLLSPTNTQGIFPTIEVLTEVMVKVKLKTGWFWWSMPFPARRFLFGFSNLQDSQIEGKGQRVEAEGGFESWDFLGDDLNGEFLEVHIVSTKMFNHPHTSCYLCVVF